jgi:hypothetical protein
VWWKRAAPVARAFGLAILLASAGCGSPAKNAKGGPRPPQLAKQLEPIDLLPADLDVVLRVDVARLKAGLGPAFTEGLAARAAAQGGDGFVAESMAKADTVWIGVRLADLDTGDRVLVAEGPLGEVHIEPSEWKETTPAATMEGVRILDRQGIVARASTGRIIVASKRLYAFVSPAEVDATSRLLRSGPDEGRGDPAALGLVSVDVRGHRLPRSLEEKFPSIAAVIAGITRVRGTAALGDDGVKVTLDVTAKSEDAAKRVEKFLVTVRDNAAQTRYAPLMNTASVERVLAHVHVTATVPARMVVAALGGDDPPAGPAGPPARP